MENKDDAHYLVVEFPAERNRDGLIPMALISSTWTFEQEGGMFCYWPSYLRSDKEKEKLIKTHSDLEKHKCMECAIVVKFSTDNYERATTKLHRLEEVSQTESELEHNEKRKSKKKIFPDYDPYFSDSEIEIPKIPQPKKKLLAKPVPSSHENKNDQNSQLYRRSTNSTTSNEYSNVVTESSAHCSFENNSQSCSQKDKQSTHSSTNNSHQKCNEKITECKGCLENKALTMEVLRQLENIRTDIKHLILNSKMQNIQPPPEPFCQFNSIEDLIEFNKCLQNEDFFSKSCSQFETIGGKDGADTIRKIMTHLITHDIALKMNWSGRNDKQGFRSLGNIITLIHVCVRKNLSAQGTTLSSVENTIKTWLRNAPDREGGRAKRKN